MNGTMTIDASQAAKLLYALFMQSTWLSSVKPVRHSDPDTEHQAVSFLLAISAKQRDGWGDVNQAVKETVVFLTSDFLMKLMQPHPAFANRQWQVSAASSQSEQAFEIIAAEIRQSHPQLARPN